MGKRCCLKDCKNYDGCGTGITFHRMRTEWRDRIPTESLRSTAKDLYICSEHFTLDNFQPSFLGYRRRMLKKTATPTIFNCATKCINYETYLLYDENSNSSQLEADPLAIEERRLTRTQETSIQVELFDRKNAEIQTSSHLLKCSDRELELKRENRVLKQRLRRRDRRIKSMMKLLEFYRNHCNIKEEVIRDFYLEDSDDDRGGEKIRIIVE